MSRKPLKLTDRERKELRELAEAVSKQNLRDDGREVTLPTRHLVVPASYVLALLAEIEAERESHAKTAKQLVDMQAYVGCLDKKVAHAVQILGGNMDEEHQ